MFKLILIVVLVYLLFRAGRNLLIAAMQDGLVNRHGPRDRQKVRPGGKSGRRQSGRSEIEDAVWEDLP